MKDLCIVLPVYNEERDLPRAVRALAEFLPRIDCTWEIVIADNGSTDRTWEIARELAATVPGVHAWHCDQKGRGRALKGAWLDSDAAILAYMDVDLSTDLAYLRPLIEPLRMVDYDLAVGSRLLKPELTRRGLKREILSRGYNCLLRLSFGCHFSDAQCGFKAIAKKAARELLPLVEDNAWFFDTELLVLAQKLGYHIFDCPVRWVEDTDSRVNIPRTIVEDLRGVWRLWRRLKNERPQGAEAGGRAMGQMEH